MGLAAARAPSHVPPRPCPFVPSSVTPGIRRSLFSGLRAYLLGQPALAANKPPQPGWRTQQKFVSSSSGSWKFTMEEPADRVCEVCFWCTDDRLLVCPHRARGDRGVSAEDTNPILRAPQNFFLKISAHTLNESYKRCVIEYTLTGYNLCLFS